MVSLPWALNCHYSGIFYGVNAYPFVFILYSHMSLSLFSVLSRLVHVFYRYVFFLKLKTDVFIWISVFDGVDTKVLLFYCFQLSVLPQFKITFLEDLHGMCCRVLSSCTLNI